MLIAICSRTIAIEVDLALEVRLGSGVSMRRSLILMFAILLCASAVALAQSPGEALFTKNCIACHGGDLAGHTNFGKRANIPDLRTSVVQNRSDGDLFASIGRGEGHKEYPHGFLSR